MTINSVDTTLHRLGNDCILYKRLKHRLKQATIYGASEDAIIRMVLEELESAEWEPTTT